MLTIDSDPENSWVTVPLRGDYSNPVVLASVPTSRGNEEAVARIRHIRHGGANCSGWCFDLRLQEPSECRDDQHVRENLAWMVIDAGVYYTDEGNLFQAGVLGLGGGAFQSITFHTPFFDHNTAGVTAISQVQTYNDPFFVKTRQQHATSEGFSVALEQTASVSTHVHGVEVVGWLAIGHGTGHIGTSAFEAGTTEDVVTHLQHNIDFTYPFASPPHFFGAIATYDGADAAGLRLSQDTTTSKAFVTIQEETCSDQETDHTTEAISYFAISPGFIDRGDSGMMFAGVRWQANQRDASEQPIGEEGFVTVAETWLTVELRGNYQDQPVVIAGVPTHNNDEELVVRIKNIRKGTGGCTSELWCFDICLQQPCNSHQLAPEHVAWVAMSKGTYYTDESAMFQVDTVRFAQQNSDEFFTVPFRGSFQQQRTFARSDLVILSQVMTNNDDRFVKTRHKTETCPAGGYTQADIDSWRDITRTGTPIRRDQWTCGGCDHPADDGWFEIQLDRDDPARIFRWFGISENILTIGTNGVLTFGAAQFQYGSSEPAPCAGTDRCPGGGGGLGVDGALAVLWCDLNVATAGAVYYEISNSATIVEWFEVPYFGHDDTQNTFEAILSFDGNVRLLYQHVDPGVSSWSIPSVGYEDQSGSLGFQIMYSAEEKEVPPPGAAYLIPAGCHSEGFAIAMESGISNHVSEPHGTETVGWWAMIEGSGHIGAKAYTAGVTPQSVRHETYTIVFGSPFHTTPRFFANMATYGGTDPSTVRLAPSLHPVTVSNAHVFIEEDTCLDEETNHVEERVGYIGKKNISSELVKPDECSLHFFWLYSFKT
eukprot:SAG31_NODE_502_length_14826_cov_5.474299_8_plen_824_part_00